MHRAGNIAISILIVDGDRELRERLEVFLRKRGYRVASCANSTDGLSSLTQESFDLVLLETKAAGMSGLHLLDQFASRCGETPIVVLSANPSVEQSVEAMHLGAADYLAIPFEVSQLARVIERALSRHHPVSASNGGPAIASRVGRYSTNSIRPKRRSYPEARDSSSSHFGNSKSTLIGSSDAMKQIFQIIDRIAQLDSSILITGATGTGKELVAHAIHGRSSRAEAPFVDINCSAIPDTLIESELFGHERGTFTGANETRRGLFEEAEGGTLFLDEVDSLDPSAQVKLLRVLQERRLRRVGGRENIPFNVRIISATNADLMKAVKKGKFRADLLFRLCVVPLEMPSLRERGNDIKLLIDHFLRAHKLPEEFDQRRFSAEAMRVLLEYSWPGNVRELENAVEYALAIGTTVELGIDDLPPNVIRSSESYTDSLKEYSDNNLRLAEVERRYIIATLERFGGHQIKTAAALGIDRRTLYRKLHQYQLTYNSDEKIRHLS
ncbi:MAG TPA: sigma-54 dependent transcriptional regulator [Pyrinomonadaceae bacterium]|nr:sigma-54 dependent transcriptional regulator [Pyrinomonadaceae bacterium]